MKKVFVTIAIIVARLLWKLRYKVTCKGLDEVKSTLENNKKGALFLPNHPAVFIDPLVTTVPLLQAFSVRPLVIEFMFYNPMVYWFIRLVNALPMPTFATGYNPIKQKRAQKMLNKMSEGLKHGENFVIYPAGMTKQGPKEVIGGAFGAYQLISENPDANIVLVRLTGLWGSMFSRALSHGDPVDMMQGIKKSFWILLKNLIFFTPRRKITLEFELAPSDFPRQGSKNEINRYLEEWYNKPFPKSGEPLQLVSYSFWKNDIPKIGENEKEQVELTEVTQDVKDAIIEKVAELAKRSKNEILPSQQLLADLGLDSLDLAELVSFLESRYDVTGINPGDLTTVSRLFLVAMKIYQKPEVKDPDWNVRSWLKKEKAEPVTLPDGDTIPEVFLRMCDQKLFDIACADPRSGIYTYRMVKMKALLMSEKIRKMPGERIGILLPSSVGVQILVLACLLADKTPVMINWTIGGRHLDTVVDVSGIQAVLTSWTFLDNLENVDISRIEEMLVVLEELKVEISLFDVLKAHKDSFRSSKTLLALPKFQHLQEHDGKKEAVVLFTSGTEAMPKGVPLSHKNILSNQRASLQAIELVTTDTLLSMLPPFHSFGFAVTGLMPLLAGLKVVFYPNPTENKRLAKAIKKWQVTILASAPTFLKNILQAADQQMMTSLRLIVSGAEKAPDELFNLALKMAPTAKIIEGYGITECSPVLSLNLDGERRFGVGKPLSNVMLKVVHHETHEPVEVDATGLVLASGPNIFNGYLNKSVSSPFLELSGTKWYITGDLGKLDEDGKLTLAGRLKRFVKVGGEMISLAAIEEALNSNISEIEKKQFEIPPVAVCAGKEDGGRPKLTLFTSYPLEVLEVNQILRQKGFSNLVKIDAVCKLDEIPMTATGKVAYRNLESMLQPNGK
jgi:acyl carrier protein